MFILDKNVLSVSHVLDSTRRLLKNCMYFIIINYEFTMINTLNGLFGLSLS